MLQNLSTKKLVQEQDSCLKSHLPPECKRCISAVFHWAAFAGYWQKPPTNKLSVHKSQLFDFQNEFSHLPFFVSFLLVTNIYRTHPCHFKLYFSLYYIWQCTVFLMFLRQRSPPLKNSNFFFDRFSAASSVGGFADPDIYRETDCTLQ